ncbi:MAG: hypothetical protein WBH99_01830, partial [Azovibrio sp.]|uniref:hypothetical protein n=1 Tax=Azovibrio sp. TaxID=1872673 RepID=UPI003C784087
CQCPEIKLNPLIKLNFCSASTSAKAAFYSTQIPCQPGAEGFLKKLRCGAHVFLTVDQARANQLKGIGKNPPSRRP